MTNKKDFKNYVANNITRDGIENLMVWLEDETDFFKSPASTKYHGSVEGGLVAHSLNVYEQMLLEMDTMVGKGWETVYSPESVAIVALFHDLCKVNSYVTEQRWRKNDEGKWEDYYPYVYNSEKRAMGHGAQSVFYLQQFITLTEDEAEAIFWHMGAYDISPYANLGGLSKTWERNALAYMISRADLAATYVLENERFIFPEHSDDEDLDEEIVEEEVIEEVEEEVKEVKKPLPLKPKPATKPKPKAEEAEEVSTAKPVPRKPANIRKPGKAVKEEVVEEVIEPVVEEVVEEVVEPKVAAKATYFVVVETMEPIKVLKGESIDFLDEGGYKEVTLKEFKQFTINWEASKEAVEESTTSSTEETYWYDPRNQEYYIVEANQEFTQDEINGVNEQLTKEEYEEEVAELEEELAETEEEVEAAEEVEVEETVEEAVEDEVEEDSTEEVLEEDVFEDGLTIVETYWYDNDSESFFSLEVGSEHPGESCEQVDKDEYDEAVESVDEFTVDTYMTDPKGKPHFFKEGDTFPEDYWAGWKEISKEEYEKLTQPKPKPVVTAKSRRTPAPSRRPRP